MQGAGNDYIYIDCRKNKKLEEYIVGIVPKLADRHFGVGGDGVVLICDSIVADCKMRIFNADGSEATMCGNGIRCVAKFVGGRSVTIETLSGIRAVTKVDKEYRVDMGTNIGNPHKVFWVENIDEIDIVGLALPFPEYNVEFAEVVEKDIIKVRVWERGSGETLACGTGACAVALSALQRDGAKTGTKTIKMRGGDLTVLVDKERRITLVGDAVVVFTGEIEI